MANIAQASVEMEGTEVVTPNNTAAGNSNVWGVKSDPGSVWGAKPQPWGSVPGPALPTAFEDVMSEELVKQFQEQEPKQENAAAAEPGLQNVNLEGLPDEQADTDSDFLLAKMLQDEMDREHDAALQVAEKKVNANHLVKLSYENYRKSHPGYDEGVAEVEEDEEDWEVAETKKAAASFSRSGIQGKGKNIVTKHDATICGRKNANMVMERFPPEFDSGDCAGMDMKLSNKVYNKLKSHSESESKRAARVHEKKEHATAEQAVDPRTRLIMFKLVNNGVLENVNGIVSSGKESVIFHADGGGMPELMVPKECILKVFKTTLAEFKNRCQYVKGDARFFKDAFKKQNPRRIMKIWAEKEMMNLKMINKAGIPCPTPILLKKHILLMSFIGQNQMAAPKLKDANLDTADMQIAYDQCVEYMKKLYTGPKLVHADLSEYNMLWHQDQLYFIDVAQAVDRMHPFAMKFLLRDCTNVTQFFQRSGVHDVPTEYELFNDITELQLIGEGEDFLQQIEEYEKNENQLRLGSSTKDYPFDFFFERAENQREEARLRLGEDYQSSSSDSDSDSDFEAKYAALRHKSSAKSPHSGHKGGERKSPKAKKSMGKRKA